MPHEVTQDDKDIREMLTAYHGGRPSPLDIERVRPHVSAIVTAAIAEERARVVEFGKAFANGLNGIHSVAPVFVLDLVGRYERGDHTT